MRLRERAKFDFADSWNGPEVGSCFIQDHLLPISTLHEGIGDDP